MLLEWDGATLPVLQRLAQGGIMPHLAQLLEESAVWRLRWRGLGSPMAAWTTLRSGCGPERHGAWDESRLDPKRRWVLPFVESKVPCPALPELLPTGRQAAHWMVGDCADATGIWSSKPRSRNELAEAVSRTEGVLESLVERACRAAAEWHLLEIRFQVLALLQHRLWHLVDVDGPGGNHPWTAVAQGAFRALDRALGRLRELAQRSGAAVALTSPYGFVPFREKITVVELLRQHGLLALAGGISAAAYRSQRLLWRWGRWLGRDWRRRDAQGVCGPVGALLPINWRRTRAVALHGQHAALIYLNTPERFGTRVLTTVAAREAALAETLAVLRQVRHPVTGEGLFDEVIDTAARFNGDPCTRGWPDAVAFPRAGLLTRQRPDHRHHLLRADPSLAAVQGTDGMLALAAPGLSPGGQGEAELTDVVPILARLWRRTERPEVGGQGWVSRSESRSACEDSVGGTSRR
jgi:predicted AlkP superfamily phosphohydrolase/phosphomutase